MSGIVGIANLDKAPIDRELLLRMTEFMSYRGPNVLTAILARDDAISRYFKLHELLTQGSAIDVRVFKKRELAAEWLGVPVALLEKQVG